MLVTTSRENPLGESTLDVTRFSEAFGSTFDLSRLRERMLAGHCLDLGSRTFSWRV